jgi:tRNA (cytidine/uridine-2'-O-)-methyltransferase
MHPDPGLPGPELQGPHPPDPVTPGPNLQGPDLHVVLVSPQIPPNTGNVIRLCANAGASLHLVAPLGFPIDHARMRRAGLDYHEFTSLQVHEDYAAWCRAAGGDEGRRFAFSTRGTRTCHAVAFQPGDRLIFGSETAGLPDDILLALPPPQRLRLPMRPDNRSLNLSNAVAIAVYEAWRQLGFAGAAA